MDAIEYPRINGKQMSSYLGRHVLMIGEVVSSHVGNSQVTIKSPDGIVMTVILPGDEVCDEPFIQVVGKVSSPTSLEALTMHTIPPGFDLENYNKVVELMNTKFSHLFN